MVHMGRTLIPFIVGALLVACSEAPVPIPAPAPAVPGPSAAELAAKAEQDAARTRAEAEQRAREGEERARVAEERRAEALRRRGVDPQKKEAEMWGGELCSTIIPCYESLDFRGNFLADVSIDLDPDGRVTSVSITGDAPKPVQACITKQMQEIVVEPYNGVAGRTRCSKSGQLMGGTKVIMSDSSYERRDLAAEAARQAEAEAAAAKGKKTKGKPAKGKKAG